VQHDIRSWSSDYLLRHLGPQLLRLHVTSGWDSCIRWFKRESPRWVASSQSEFDAIASVKVEHEARRLNSIPVKHNLDSLLKAVNGGVRQTVPAKLRHKKIEETISTQHIGKPDEEDHVFRHVEKSGVDEDAQQDAFVRLLESGQADGRSAHVFGMSAGRDATRDNLKYVPESQTERPQDEAGEFLPPWEQSIDRESRDFDDAVWKLLGEATDIRRKELLLAFWDKNEADMAFLISYLARKGYRKRPASQKDRDRAAGIIKRLRRLESHDA